MRQRTAAARTNRRDEVGTNYYWQPACDVCGCTHERPPREHIGKSSAGWVFTFHATSDVRSAQAWRELTEGGGKIVDEYGQRLTPVEFWLMVEQKKTSPHHHAREYPRDSFVGPDGESMSEGEFS